MRTISYSIFLVAYLLAFVAHSLASGDQSTTQPLTAEEILDRMAKVYADCKSYSDSGTVKTTYFQTNRTWTEEKAFKTSFVRPDRFRFEYSVISGLGTGGRCIVWCNGNDVQSWSTFGGLKKEESLSLAVAGAAGVSSGSSHAIPALLMMEISGRKLNSLDDAKQIEDQKLGDIDCIRVTGKFSTAPMTLWLDKSTFHVLRIDQQTILANFRTEEITTYQPVIDKTVDEPSLKFDAPTK